MAAHLPQSSVVAHGVAAAQVAPVAAWESVGLIGSGADTEVSRVGGVKAPSTANFEALASVAVFNQSMDEHDVFFALVAEAPATTADAIRVPPGQPVAIDLYGSSTPPLLWIYGHASAPAVQIIMTLAEVP